MSLTKSAIENRYVTYFAVILLVVAGLASYFSLGRLEDPEFAVKNAVIVTGYPGASASEVQNEVTDQISKQLQEIPEMFEIEGFSSPGVSTIKVAINEKFGKEYLPQIWDALRNKVDDARADLPGGVTPSIVYDDFGDVFGFVIGIQGTDDYSFRELEDIADDIKKRMSIIKGVSRAELWGIQEREIYVEVNERQLVELGVTMEQIVDTLKHQNLVVDGGKLSVGDTRPRVRVTGSFKRPEDIEQLTISGAEANDELITIGSLGRVVYDYQDPPATILKLDGKKAVSVYISNAPGVNIVKLGEKLDSEFARIKDQLPTGVELKKIAWQSDLVDKSISDFVISLIEAVVIVLIVLAVPLGWRMGVIIGSGLILTILGTFVFMSIFETDFQRMSLGALIIALGMMVDNSIVIADGIYSRMQQGMDKLKAAVESVQSTQLPLLGATVIAVMAFYPIFSAENNTGEYCETLFTVVAISLLFSWIISITVTPLQCMDMLKVEKTKEGEDPLDTPLFRKFKSILTFAIRKRYLTIATMIGLLLFSIVSFKFVPQMFFPSSTRPQLMVDYYLPQGAHINGVEQGLQKIEEHLLKQEGITLVSSFIGAGPPRFYLPVDPEPTNPSYGQIIINVDDFEVLDALYPELKVWTAENVPEAMVRVRRFALGPSNTWKFQLRILGPSGASYEQMRSLAQEGEKMFYNHPLIAEHQISWRQRSPVVELDYNQERGRWAGIQRQDIADTMQRAFDKYTVGEFRDGDKIMPISVRHTLNERQEVQNLTNIQMRPNQSTVNIPIIQTLDGKFFEWEESKVDNFNRRPSISLEAEPIDGVTFPTLKASLINDISEFEKTLPPGYELFWDGEEKSTVESQEALVPGAIPALLIMVFTVVALFNAYKPPLIIFSAIPFAMIGITLGLLLTRVPFGFVALLGAMSLAGMMIKNAIVLLDQVDLNLKDGDKPYDAVINAAISRLRPVMLAAGTTVLGVIPLLQDVFWVSMAVTIMFGLAFGTVITMVLVPVLYATFYKIRSPK